VPLNNVKIEGVNKSMKQKKIYMWLLIVILIGSGIYFAFTYFNSKGNEETSPIEAGEHSPRNFSENQQKTWEETITIGAIGDILIHGVIYEDAQEGLTYNFDPVFEHVKDQLLAPDILVANQESVLGGKELGLSTYPAFNSPHEVGETLIEFGVDIFTTANNHTLDRGEKAILSAIDFYERMGVPYVGHFKSFEDQNTIRVIQKNGIKVAFLAYTYGTNGIPVPEGKEYLVNLIDLDRMKADVKKAKKEADVIVMSIHWGYEYHRLPNDEQRLIAEEMSRSGVDIIFGSHPHVLQPFDWIETEEKRTFVVYSLGNFISGQIGEYREIGGVASIYVTKRIEEDGTVTIELKDPDFFPTWVANDNRTNFRVVPLIEADKHGMPNAKEKNEEIMEHMFQWIE